MADHQPSEPTRKRLSSRSRQGLGAAALVMAAAFVRFLISGRGLVLALVLVGLLILASVVFGAVIFWCFRRADARRRASDPSALYAGRATLYLDQMAQCPELAPAVRNARTRRIRFWSQGQGLLEGSLRLDRSSLDWTPMRMARRSDVEPWRLPVEEVSSIEVSPGAIPVGVNGIVTVHLASGHFVDLMVTDRHRFADAWSAAQPG